jgi:glycosyltransferase involved in cell wall biosynthesis
MSLRLGIVHWAFPPVIGGVEMHLLTVAPEMVRQGAQVFILCGSIEKQPGVEEVEGVRVERVNEMNPDYAEELRGEGQDLYPIYRELFDHFLEQYDLEAVQAHNLHYDFFDLSMALKDACQAKGIPCYLIVHNDVFIDRSWETTRRIVGEIDWDKLVAISHYLKETLNETVPQVSAEKWTVIMHGIDLEKFHPLKPAEQDEWKQRYGFAGKKIILHPGRFLPWKGILPAIKAMPRVREEFPQAVMVLTGRKQRLYKEKQVLVDYDDQIDSFIEEHHLGENIHIGDYDHEDIPRLASICDVVIYTTIGDEPFGLVPVEGMACAAPAIVTRSGGLVESVVDGETGYIIDKDEKQIPEQLAQRILELLSNPGLAEQMGAKGRKRAEEKFDKARMAQDFIQLSETLIEKKQAGTS